MRLYAGTVTQFRADTQLNQIAEKLKASYFYYFRQNPSHSEMNSWRNSLRAVSGLFAYCELDDHGVILEYQLPLSSKRLDCLVTGTDGSRRGNAVIIELKQWEASKPAQGENEVVTYLGGGEREVLHPSVQVGRYKMYLEDYHSAFYEGADPIRLAACSYLHNYAFAADDPLLSDKFSDSVVAFPVFSADDVPRLREFLRLRIGKGDGIEILDRVLNGKYRPSRKLMEHVVGVIAGYPEFVLLDEQLVVFDKVLSSVTRGIHDRRKQVVLVKGGPGTGKSVIAINLMADLMRRGFNAHYATGSKAFTQTLRKVIGARGAGQFKYFNSYTDAPRDEIDALICDEAHRLRESSNDRFHPKKSRPGQMQIDELINAGRVTVFFIDDDQVVRPGEIGSAEHVRDSAKRLACELSEYELEIQFRCGGSDSFVRWIENTLEIKKTPNILWARNEDFDFRIMDSPLTMERAIREKAAEGFRARMMAGFCWPWSKALASDGQLTEDVVIGSYIRPWNAFPEIKKLPKSIPPAPLWANDPEGIGQIGCVYTAQGFEFDYAGVIFGTDLRYSFDKGAWEGHPEDSKDSQVRRSKGGFMDLVKNTYRVLLSRAHKGCYVCFLDKETERFFRSRMERESRPARDEERVADGIVPLGPAQTLFMDALPLLSPEAWDGARKGAKAVPEVIPVPKGKYSGSHFLFRAHENTMRPVIAQGALCLFRKPKQEAVEGRIILLKAEGINEKPTIATLRGGPFWRSGKGTAWKKPFGSRNTMTRTPSPCSSTISRASRSWGSLKKCCSLENEYRPYRLKTPLAKRHSLGRGRDRV